MGILIKDARYYQKDCAHFINIDPEFANLVDTCIILKLFGTLFLDIYVKKLLYKYVIFVFLCILLYFVLYCIIFLYFSKFFVLSKIKFLNKKIISFDIYKFSRKVSYDPDNSLL